LKNNLESSPAQSRPDKLVVIFVFLVSPNLEVGKETFDRLIKRDSMRSKFVILEIIFKV